MTAPTTDESWRPRAAECDTVIVNGDAVVYAGGQVHVLNPQAALVWQSCDGRVSVTELAEELAGSFGVERDAVLPDVVSTLAALAAKGLLELPDAASPEAAAIPILVPPPLCSACGPGPQYSTYLVVDVGGAAVTVGVDPETAEVLEFALGPRVVARQSPSERPSYGVVLPATQPDDGPRSVARLHRGPDVLFRSRDSERVLRALLAQLATHAPPDGGLVLEAVAVGVDQSVTLVGLPDNRVAFARRADRSGLRVSDAPNIVVMPERGVAQVGTDWSDVDPHALHDLAVRRGDAHEPGALPWGEYPISALEMSGSASAIAALGEFGAVLQPGVDARANWDLFAALLARVPLRHR